MGFGSSESGQAEIIVIGDEVISGLIVDTNSKYLAQRIFELGLSVSCITKIGDNFSVIEDEIEKALQRSDWIILTGGLGGTHDDITKSVVTKVFGSNLRQDEKVETMLKEIFRKRNREIPESVKSQSQVPDNCQVFYNEMGTAPGFRFERNEHALFCLPGVPHEMKNLFEQYIVPELKERSTQAFCQRILKTTGISEASLWETVGPLDELQKKATIASLPSHLGVRIRISCLEKNKDKGEAKLDEVEQSLRESIDKYIYGKDEECLEAKVGELLMEKSMTLATAESCTGGLIGHRLTQISGSSNYYKEGFVVYSNEAKVSRLGVEEKKLEAHGAVSEPVARAMAKGVCKVTGADIGVSVTGIAGPTGGTPEKPVGLTFIAVSDGENTWCRKYIYTHDRIKNKERVAQTALNLVRMKLLGLLTEEN
ncbi:MAG: competence/damage-inducible protein A [Nitrospinota bacterium]